MNEQIACPRCQIGNLNADKATYTTVYNGMLLSVPNMIVWKCDICEYQEFDYESLTHIEALAGPFGVPNDPVRPSAKLPQVDVDNDLTEGNLPHRVKP